MFRIDHITIGSVVVGSLIFGGVALIGYFLLATRSVRLHRRVEAICPARGADRVESSATSSIVLFIAEQHRRLFGLRYQRDLAPFMAAIGVSAEAGVIAFVALRLVAVFAALASVVALLSGIGPDNPSLLLLAALLLAAVFWFAPDIILKSFVSRRTQAIERELPEALELLVICTEAGLPLEAGLKRVVDEMKTQQPELARELAVTLADLAMLPDSESALRRLADRVQLESLTVVTSTLIQTMRFGTPLAKALRVMAAELRDQAIAKLEERANRLPVLLTIPMIVFLLPTIFLVVGGPALLRVLDMFGG